MELNTKKTNMLVINKTRNRQAVPFCSLQDGEPLPIVKEMRLLGVVVDEGLTWWPLVLDIVQRCRCKIWSLLKLREAGASEDQLLCLYIARVRATLDYGAVVYGTMINESQSEELESVQAKCLQIVRGQKNESYSKNLTAMGLVSLAERRSELITTFAISTYRSEEHRWWYTPHPPLPLITCFDPPRFLVPF